MIKFTEEDKKIGVDIFRKFKEGKNKNHKWWLLTFNALFRRLNKEERELIKNIMSTNPSDYGKKGTFFGIKPAPKDLVSIKHQKFILKGKSKIVKTQFLPKQIFSAYACLNDAMRKEIGRSVNILSGYRSPASQAALFFCNLYLNDWNIGKTLKRVALSGYSEHGYPPRQAIDFGPAKGIENIRDFYKTKEYKWLLKNAGRFKFYLSFPRNNKSGTMFEPWHWHYENKKIKDCFSAGSRRGS